MQRFHGGGAAGSGGGAAFARTGQCNGVLRGHKPHSFMLDNDFSPAYAHFVKKDRPYKTLSIIC
jgi:hypothetical protein